MIELTQRELEEIKDDEVFKTTTTVTLKHIKETLEVFKDMHDDVTSLKNHRTIHWLLISGIFLAILSTWIKSSIAG